MSLLKTLCALMSASPSPGRPLARRAGVLLDDAAFHAQARRWAAAFATLDRDVVGAANAVDAVVAAAPGAPHVALHFEDTVEFAAALFGLWAAGGTAWLPGDLQPATLQALRGRVSALASDAPTTAPGLAEDAALPRIEAAATPDDRTFAPLDAEAERLVIFTSGSTGLPGAIPKRLRELFAEVDALEQAFGARLDGAEILGLVSHQHIYGLLYRVLWPLAAGRVLHAERLSYVETLLAALREGPRFAVIASPAHLKRLPPAESAPQVDADHLALIFSSGGPLPDEAVPDCRRLFGQAPLEVYGSSETGGVAWRQRDAGAPTTWTALPGIDWQADDTGTLRIRSRHLPDPAEWFESADRVRLTAEGFELLGRADRIVKIEGKRVSLQTIETVLRDSGWLEDLRVFVLEPGAREQLAVAAQLNDAGWAEHDARGKAAFAQLLRDRLAPHLERIALPRRWRFLSQLPVNAQGKVTVAALTRLFDPRRPGVRLLARSTNEVTLRLSVDASLPQFDGHFPGHPILPGVAQLDWVMLLAREWLPLPPTGQAAGQADFAGIDNLKFQQVISPGMTVELTLAFSAPLLSFSYRSAAGSHAVGKIRLQGTTP
ncbi:AMP-binding protein [Roseateles sp. L2-2]|uniref:AMP-binding protein n=1 Tax=Roseateles sp. L2-2 TaxID=3422597 RepID=UPI003D36F7E4